MNTTKPIKKQWVPVLGSHDEIKRWDAVYARLHSRLRHAFENGPASMEELQAVRVAVLTARGLLHVRRLIRQEFKDDSAPQEPKFDLIFEQFQNRLHEIQKMISQDQEQNA
jgi:hypothetical protein